ncbi:AAA+-type ATPase, SpoVK/Ycf46/Vps4 family [Succinivibrio dextrinosolvens]|uniref:AAA family ATPase n=1 Tax=Succinivibrio dextrinosolvens TaxID=83771 RepID=UPI0008F1FE7B|nr:ATP-binding protein [Succinivibrio dextrinosolvens]SFS33075.1 AAA+-type ATPase, SpoVK/Ycf46/Vps4 family [Succinivibrio dextrinosolvens]
MSTEICINYSDELNRYVGCSLDNEESTYSSLGRYQKALLKEALSGNVKREYGFALSGNYTGSEDTKNSIGDSKTVKKEALFEHSALAQEPDALVHSAFQNYFGGLATEPDKKKAFCYATKACLQGNYDALGVLWENHPVITHPLYAAYRLEFLINSNARSLYRTFFRAFNRTLNREPFDFQSKELNTHQYTKFCAYSERLTEDEIELRRFYWSQRRMIIKMAFDFSLGSLKKIQEGETPDEADDKEYLHFLYCLSLLEEIRQETERHRSYRALAGLLNILRREVSDLSSHKSLSRILFDKGMEIVITRMYLENYSKLASHKGSNYLKALADRLITRFEDEKDTNPYRRSPYCIRLISLYEVYIRNGNIHQELNEVLNKCTVPVFNIIANELAIEKLVASTLSDLSKKYKGETILIIENDKLSYNSKSLAGYLADAYKILASNLVRICEGVNTEPQSSIICKEFYVVCAAFIRGYMVLDPVLAYNNCEFSEALRDFIKYAIDNLSLPPQMLADIKKPVPYYGFTATTALGLYLLDNSEGKYSEQISILNKHEQEIVDLRLQILEKDLNKIVKSFDRIKDNPSDNYDYLLKEFLHKMSCFDLDKIVRQHKSKDMLSHACKLQQILITRALSQQSDTKGIAAECVHELTLNRHFLPFLEKLEETSGGSSEFEELKKKLAAFESISETKYPKSLLLIGGPSYGLYAMNRLNSLFIDIRKLFSAADTSEIDKDRLKQSLTHYYRYLLAYNLCNPLKENKELFAQFENGYIGCLQNRIYPTAEAISVEVNEAEDIMFKIPNMKVIDSSLKDKTDLLEDLSKKSDRSKKKVKEVDLDDSSTEEEVSEKHYELKNADKPLHIVGNRKLSQILNEKIIKVLKSDPVKMKLYGLNIVPNFILYGEPGCGKTEAVRQFCEHLGLDPVVINSATIGATCIHETPKNIHEKFDEAFEKKNGVVIIDEADAFLNEREGLSDNQEHKVEELGAFLQCFDKAVKMHTLVISMTNYLNKIDKAILRDGRLGLHVEITNPDKTDLEEIINNYFQKSELDKLDKTQMVKALNGQTIASVFSIFNGIRMDVVMNDVELSHQYVMEKINNALGYTLKPGAHFSLPGQQEFEDYVNKNIVDHLVNPDVYRKFNLKFPNSILLYGPTGTGKTYAAKQLAEFLGWDFIKLDSKSIGSENVQGSAIKIARVFDRARREAPCILFIDEIDAWIPKRNGRSHNSEISQVNEFLSNMSQLNSDNLLLIGTTNRIDDIDEAALRNGRFSTKIEIGYMKGEQVEELLSSLIKDIPYDDSIDLSEIAKTQDNKSVADIVAFFEKACRFSAENKYDFLTKECFQKAMDTETKKDECRRIGFL